ncbi:hypothetical protein GH714_032943 [Hevea brasiliensis]|uniref:Protein FAR1-RELATED SEQUENCE n=1 Tax=Hevea brasiliensis TaxID=3981 RepID=A0A6A6L5U6_HEVBR|nr:hypothetical protein GH714_032943 [Hevea brasiliensis]
MVLIKEMEVEIERRQRELYDTLGIRDDDSLLDENTLSDEPFNSVNGTPSQLIKKSRCKNLSQAAMANIQTFMRINCLQCGGRSKSGMHFPTMDNLVDFCKEHARVAYEEFHDVICFDTTYLVNRYQMPFATFVGVNHHGQSILLEKFKGVEDFTKATNEFKALIFDTLMIEMFERNWNEFLTKYGLENNEWLTKLYFERESWVPIYLNHVFWAGMMSTQKSEGMHAYFDGYVNSRSTLKQFVEQYEMAICGKTEKELLSEFILKNRVVNCISQFGWEKQFQHAFTHEIFKLVQE